MSIPVSRTDGRGRFTWTGSLHSDERPSRPPRGGPSCLAISIRGSQGVGRRNGSMQRLARHSKGCRSRPAESCHGRTRMPEARAPQMPANGCGKRPSRTLARGATGINSSITLLTLRIWPLFTPKPVVDSNESSASSPGELPTDSCQITSAYGRTSRPSDIGRATSGTGSDRPLPKSAVGTLRPSTLVITASEFQMLRRPVHHGFGQFHGFRVFVRGHRAVGARISGRPSELGQSFRPADGSGDGLARIFEQ